MAKSLAMSKGTPALVQLHQQVNELIAPTETVFVQKIYSNKLNEFLNLLNTMGNDGEANR
jgi:hypothetical protein